MTKPSIVTLLVLLLVGSAARANGTQANACEQDPRCLARELAETLTSSAPRAEPAVELRHVIAFEPGRVRVYSQSREKLQALVAKWRHHLEWSVITVRGYAMGSVELAQRRADKIRGYLIRYGVPPELVVARADEGGATVDLSIEVCADRTSCRHSVSM